MGKTIYTCVTACLGIVLLLSSSCNSSEELMHPATHQVTASQGNRFMNNVEVSPNNTRQIKVLAGDATPALPQNIDGNAFNKYANIVGLVPKAMSNYILYQFIDEWYGVKYCYGGSDKGGIDCSAFVQKLYEEVFCTNLVRTARDQFQSCSAIWDIDKLIEGDLVFFKTRGRSISHVGIYLANNFFVHASTTGGVMISNLKEVYWSKRFAGAGKIPKGTGEKQML